MNKRILIAGGTGLIGTVLSQAAKEKQYDVFILSRQPGLGTISWDPSVQKINITSPEYFDAIVNLAGSSIAKGRWTAKKKQDVLQSRLDSCATLYHYLQQGLLKTKIYIGTSGVGYYRDSGAAQVDESTATTHPGDWMVETVKAWEEAHRQMETLGIRTCIFRTGIVLSKDGGALKELLLPAKFGVIPYFGNGDQFWSWIHIEDVVSSCLYAIDQDDMEGLFLAVSPHAVTNKQLAHAMSKQYWIKMLVAGVPVLVLRLMLGELHTVLLDSCNAYPARLLEKNYQFRFPEIEFAMRDLIQKKE
jgi:uncharacterized protein (TIGR01777 family)